MLFSVLSKSFLSISVPLTSYFSLIILLYGFFSFYFSHHLPSCVLFPSPILHKFKVSQIFRILFLFTIFCLCPHYIYFFTLSKQIHLYFLSYSILSENVLYFYILFPTLLPAFRFFLSVCNMHVLSIEHFTPHLRC